jgi:hypothetical protein
MDETGAWLQINNEDNDEQAEHRANEHEETSRAQRISGSLRQAEVPASLSTGWRIEPHEISRRSNWP